MFTIIIGTCQAGLWNVRITPQPAIAVLGSSAAFCENRKAAAIAPMLITGDKSKTHYILYLLHLVFSVHNAKHVSTQPFLI